MPRKPNPRKNVNFGPIRLRPETLDALHREAGPRSAASVVRELIELWLEARKKKSRRHDVPEADLSGEPFVTAGTGKKAVAGSRKS